MSLISNFSLNQSNMSSSYYFSNHTDRMPLNYYYYYVHPTFVLFAMVIGILCTYILAQKELRTSGAFFQYAAVNSGSSAIAAPFLAMYFVTRCGSLCKTSETFWAQIYEIYGIYFFTSSVFFSTSLVQIAISFQLYFSVTNKFKKLNSVPPKYVMLVLFLVSFGLGAAIPFAFQVQEETYVIIQNGVETVYTVWRNRIDPSNMVLVYITYTVIIFSNWIFLIILIVVNIMIFVELRKLMAKKLKLIKKKTNVVEPKSEITNVSVITVYPKGEKKPHHESSQEQESMRKTLIMTLWISVVFCSHRLAYAIANILLLFYEGTPINEYASAAFYFYGSLVYSSYIVVYYLTNKIFRRKFNQLILRRKS